MESSLMKIIKSQDKARLKGWGNRLYTCWEELQNHVTKQYGSFQQILPWDRISTCKIMNLDSFLTSYTEINKVDHRVKCKH